MRLTPADHPKVGVLMDRLNDYLDAMYPAETNHVEQVGDLLKSNVIFVAAWQGEEAVGCGAVKVLHDPDEAVCYGEIKRVFVTETVRGQGISHKLMAFLENAAKEAGASVTRLETGGLQQEALSLYESRGYRYREKFFGYSSADTSLSLFMEKLL